MISLLIGSAVLAASNLNPCAEDFKAAHYSQIEASLTLSGGPWKDGKRKGVLHHYGTLNYNANDTSDPVRIENVSRREDITFSCSVPDKNGMVDLTFFHANGTPFQSKAFLYSEFDIGWGSWIMTAMHPSCAKLGEAYFENDNGDKIYFGQHNSTMNSFLEVPSWTRFIKCEEGGTVQFMGLYGESQENYDKVEFTGTYNVERGEVAFQGKTYRRSTKLIRIRM